MSRMPLPDAVAATIRAMHEGPERGYHGWSHPLDLLEITDSIRPLLNDALAVRCADILHDCIYEAHANDNEERSARFAEGILLGHVPDVTIGRTSRLILSTAHHALTPGLDDEETSDMAHFLDMDLSILGVERARFDAYEEGVRHEYRSVPIEDYRRGRAEILRRFLLRERLYMTEWGRDSYEAQARRNLRYSIAKLAA